MTRLPAINNLRIFTFTIHNIRNVDPPSKLNPAIQLQQGIPFVLSQNHPLPCDPPSAPQFHRNPIKIPLHRSSTKISPSLHLELPLRARRHLGSRANPQSENPRKARDSRRHRAHADLQNQPSAAARRSGSTQSILPQQRRPPISHDCSLAPYSCSHTMSRIFPLLYARCAHTQATPRR